MPARTGADFLAGLADDRTLYLGGERIENAAPTRPLPAPRAPSPMSTTSSTPTPMSA